MKRKTIIEMVGTERAKEMLDKVIQEGEEFFIQMKKDYPEKYFQISCYIDEILCNYPNRKIPKDFAEKTAKKHNVHDIYLKEMFRILMENLQKQILDSIKIKSFNAGG